MKSALHLLLFTFCVFCCACSDPRPAEVAAAEVNLPDKISFNYHVKPLLSDRCYKCHGPDAAKRKGELRLDIDESAYTATKMSSSQATFNISPGSLRKSEVFARIISDEPDYMMPPPESHLQLSAEEKALLAKWIEQGAEYESHWSFETPKRSELPEIDQEETAYNEIDHFIIDAAQSQGLEMNELADRSTLLRRVSLDLTGLPPTPEDIRAFLKDDAPDAYEQAVDRLLATTAYAEQMAVYWMDVARYADTHGYQDDGLRTVWPWRDWVIRSFNENQAFDEFITWQLAGDLLPNPTTDQLLATCFLRNHPQTQEGGVVDEEYRIEYVADRTNTFGKAFLGFTTECARCHDHKYDPISQKEYYQLSAFFNNNNESGIVPYSGEASPTLMMPTPAEKKTLDSLKQIIQPLEQELLPENFTSAFETWYNKKKGEIKVEDDLKKDLVAHFAFEKDVDTDGRYIDLGEPKPKEWLKEKLEVVAFRNEVKNRLDSWLWGDINGRPEIAPAKTGNGIRLIGDCGLRFNRDLDFDRYQPFTVSIWIKKEAPDAFGPIFNKSNGSYEGYRGWHCVLNEDQTLTIQFNHVWPNNAIDLQSKDTLALNEWTHLALAYSGNSKASGVSFYINGVEQEMKILVDNLNKSVLHAANKGTWQPTPFLLGIEQLKSIKGVMMDELKVYKRQLSEIEVDALHKEPDQQAPIIAANLTSEAAKDYYLLSGKNKDYKNKLNQLTQVRKAENDLITDVMEVMIMQERKYPRATFVMERGAYDAPTEKVNPQPLSVFDKVSATNRLELAEWLTHPDHPLTARVAVNRFWTMCFGKGLVATSEDFGNQGELPTHPELLDWLARDFIASGWDVKGLMKKIVTSSTYRRSSVPSENQEAVDPANTYYAYYPAHRLSAETIRDQALAASGLLVDTVGGPSVYPYQPKGIWKALATRNAFEYHQQSGDSLYRRSMYTIWKRSSPPPSMMNFDAPDRYTCTVKRQQTATPLQSLVLMNDPQFVEAARVLATTQMKAYGDNNEVCIKENFLALIGRPIRNDELAILQNLYKKSIETFKQQPEETSQWLEVGDYPLDQELDVPQLAAHTLVTSTIMNFEGFVMKR